MPLFRQQLILVCMLMGGLLSETLITFFTGISLDRENNKGFTALQEAARFGFASTADVLINLGNRQDCLTSTVTIFKATTVSADSSGQNSDFYVFSCIDSSSSMTGAYSVYLFIVEPSLSLSGCLVDTGAKVNKIGSNHRTALDQASANGHTEAARVLLHAGGFNICFYYFFIWLSAVTFPSCENMSVDVFFKDGGIFCRCRN